METIAILDPLTGDKLHDLESHSAKDVALMFQEGREAQPAWNDLVQRAAGALNVRQLDDALNVGGGEQPVVADEDRKCEELVSSHLRWTAERDLQVGEGAGWCRCRHRDEVSLDLLIGAEAVDRLEADGVGAWRDVGVGRVGRGAVNVAVVGEVPLIRGGRVG